MVVHWGRICPIFTRASDCSPFYTIMLGHPWYVSIDVAVADAVASNMPCTRVCFMCFTNVSRALQNNLAKIHIARNHIYGENLKLKLCTCAAQSMALCPRTNFKLGNLLKSMISVRNKFRGNILKSSWNVSETPQAFSKHGSGVQRQQCHATFITLRWRHNGRYSVSIHQPHDCLLNRLFGRRSRKTSKRRVTGLCAGNSPGTGEFSAQMASKAENASIWWRHHDNELHSLNNNYDREISANRCFLSC